MNLGELIADFRRDADDNPTAPMHIDDDVTGWLNEAEHEACIRANLIYDTEIEVDIDSSGRVYSIPVTLISLRHAKLIDSSGTVTEIGITDRHEMDRSSPGWREESKQPASVIHDEDIIEMTSTPDAAYTLIIEGYRLPKNNMSGDGSEPEISVKHHRFLVKWALHRAYSIPDKDFADPKKAEQALKEFEDYFGMRLNATTARRAAANRPHRNKCYF